jgi:hypothetical protein
MHLLPDSRVLNCRHEGPHVHVRRRVNANGAFAKARQPRAIPVDEVTIELYAHYQFERAEIVEDSGDMVLSGYPDNTICPESGVIRTACRNRCVTAWAHCCCRDNSWLTSAFVA